jgi:diadenosine tetraphosphate (Ap4A) HIT family hydrolase
MRDIYPVSEGHALIIPRRHCETWFDATREEQIALLDGLDAVRAITKADGFNIGVNAGRVAGQTVFHLHVHLIPRFDGDVPDPRGGVRHVIPSRGNWQVPTGRDNLVTGASDPEQGDPLLPHLDRCIADASMKPMR